MFAYFDNLELPVASVGEVSVDYSANFASHALIARKPKLQYVAMSSRQVSLHLRYHYSDGDVQKRRKALLNRAREHQAGTLAFGGGIVLGIFVIESISESYSQTDGTGRVMIAEYDVTFKEAGNEPVPAAQAPAVKAVSATTAASDAQQKITKANPAKVSGAPGSAQKATTAAQIVRRQAP